MDESTETQAGPQALEEKRLLLEERRLHMEERRWRAEMESKERILKAELELKERQRRDELELKERQRQDELNLKEKELELKRLTAEKEERHRETPAVKLKLWGDALRNTITRMPTEAIDVVSWFVALDRLFDQLSVPDDLRAILMRPYLNERAKNLLARSDCLLYTSDAADE